MSNQKVIGVIPIRSGSKGLPNKNTRLLAGVPLFAHAIQQGRIAGISRFVISTDISSVFDMTLGDDVTVANRPSHLATDHATMNDVLCDLLESTIIDDATIVLLQAISPLRTAEDIRSGIAAFNATDDNLVMSICPADRGVLKHGVMQAGRFTPMRDLSHLFSNRQALPLVYKPNGAIYVFGADWFRRNRSLETVNLGTIEMTLESSIDIDTDADLIACEEQLKNRQKAGIR